MPGLPCERKGLLGTRSYSVRIRVPAQYCLAFGPVERSPPGSSVHGTLRQECWSGLLFPAPGIFPARDVNPGLLRLLHRQAGSLPLGDLCSPPVLGLVLSKPEKTQDGGGIEGRPKSHKHFSCDCFMCCSLFNLSVFSGNQPST